MNMAANSGIFNCLVRPSKYTKSAFIVIIRRSYHRIPFLDLYEKTTGLALSEKDIPLLKKKHPHIDTLSHNRLQSTLQILNKFGITPQEACLNPHIFSMNPITMDNYGEILKECGFITIIPKYIIRYHTLVKSRTIAQLKKQGLMRPDIVLLETLQKYFTEWPSDNKIPNSLPDSTNSILTVRMSVLEKYLHWKLHVTSEEFQKYCRLYLPLKHKPMSDIIQAIHLALNVIKFEPAIVRRNGFIIATDPVKTQLIIDNVKTLAGLDVREAIRLEPSILKNNHTALLELKTLFEDYQITIEAQQRYLRIFCMAPKTIQARLDELRQLKEYQVLATNPRVLWLVVHKRKMLSRLTKIQEAKKQCYSLNNLVASNKIFDNYISGFGNKICGRDIAILISSSVHSNGDPIPKRANSESLQAVLNKLKRHKYWLHAALSVVDENIRFLKSKFSNEIIFNHCQLLLYPASEIEYYLDHFLQIRSGEMKISNNRGITLDANYNNLQYTELTDSQILSLVLYEIEKKYHFSGDGIWAQQEGSKMEAQKA